MPMLLMLVVELYECCALSSHDRMFMHSWSVQAMMKSDDVATVGSLGNIPLISKYGTTCIYGWVGTLHTFEYMWKMCTWLCESMWKMCTWLCVTMWKMCDLTTVMTCGRYIFNLVIIWWSEYLLPFLWWCFEVRYSQLIIECEYMLILYV